MTICFDKKYLIKHFIYFGFIAYLFGYIAHIKDISYLLILTIIFGMSSLGFLCMWIRSFFWNAIELNEVSISILFLFSKKTFQTSSILDKNIEKKKIFILNNKGKKYIYTLKWITISDLKKLKEIIN